MTSMFFVSSAIRASVVLLAGLAASSVLSWASAATRRAVLVLALGASIVVPLAAAVIPAWHVEAPAMLGVFGRESSLEGRGPVELKESAERDASTAPTVSAAHPAVAIMPIVVWALWFAGFVTVMMRAWGSSSRARRLVGRSTRVSGAAWAEAITRAGFYAGATADVHLCDAIDSPAVTGVWTSIVLLPVSAAGWSAERRRVVLVHELAHVRHHDGLAQLVAQAACAWSWFNPLAWICAHRLRVERELAADDAVLAAGVRASFYAEELLVHAGSAGRGVLAMAERSALSNRVVAILATQRARGDLAVWGKTLLGASSAVVAVGAACTLPTAMGGGIDPKMQAAAEAEVTALLEAATGESATVVVLDPATGKVLADAGRRGGEAFDVARDQAMSPGSTLKTVTLAAAIETSSIQPGELFRCGPEPRGYPDGEMEDSRPHGMLDVPHMLAVSSNIGVSRIFDALGGSRLGDWLERFHFGQAVALPGAASGLVPASITTGTLQGAEVASGEGMTATPLQIAAAYAALSNDGVYHAPSLAGPAAPAERLVSSATAQEIMSMLKVVVDDEWGTGTRARVEGAHVAGKTGTAVWTTPDGHKHTYASFVGVADVTGRRIVALVGVETLREDVSGGQAAAPAFAHLVSQLR
jgi:beta-lactamase regulating signal transducer with metallopeptidase domain